MEVAVRSRWWWTVSIGGLLTISSIVSIVSSNIAFIAVQPSYEGEREGERERQWWS